MSRAAFATQVHAEAHAIVALRQVRRLLNADAPRAVLHTFVDDEITRRCQRLGLAPDLLGDAIEAAEDDLAIAAMPAEPGGVHCLTCDNHYSPDASDCPECAAADRAGLQAC